MVQPGETISDQSWIEVPDNGEVALKTELVVGKVAENGPEGADKDEAFGWGTRDIVNLLDIRGNITDTPNGDAESEGGIWSFLKAKAPFASTKKP
jgi:hypothetical protein